MNLAKPGRGWLLAAVLVSAALVLGSPFIGQARSAFRAATGDRFATLVSWMVVGTAGIALAAAVSRIRDRRAFRYGALFAAAAIGTGYSLAARTGNPEVDAVELFHFIEYGLVTALFYRAWRPVGDGSLFLQPILAGLIVATLEEWLQWFVPARVGEVRDVLLNGFAIACGLLFSLALDPPARPTIALSRASHRGVFVMTAAALVLFGAFMHTVHLGYEIRDAETGVFRSAYTADELLALSEDRRTRWARNPPVTWSRLSREDQYFSEGVAHVQRRNETWEEGNVLASRHENLILEKYFAPVLDTPSYVSALGHRWSPAQREDAESRLGPVMIYVSDAIDYPIVTWPKWAFWTVIGVGAALALREGLRRA